VEKYNFKVIENKWQKFWEENQSYKTEKDLSKKKILLFGNVSIPIRQNSYGACKKLYNR
jgi:leucyl-tRNA synthetase